MTGEKEKKKKKEYTFSLLHRRAMYLRVDIAAVAIVTVTVFYNFGWQLTDKENLLAMGCLVLSILLNGVLLLNNYWSVGYNQTIAYKSLYEGDIGNCTHVRVRIDNKKQNSVKNFIVPIIHKDIEVLPGKLVRDHQVEVHKKKFSYSADRKTFAQIPYPVDDPISFYQECEGIVDKASLNQADLVWGPNKMSVPIPQFLEIYKEHMVAPFFIFQLFTTCLWLLDDYWYFSLMQLWMLFFFEGTVVFQRVQSFKRLRAMRVAPRQVFVHRAGKWELRTSENVFPGDVILLTTRVKPKGTTKKIKQTVPCDLLVLSGSAVVNEAILTGESQPLVKDSVANLDKVDE